MIQIMKNYRICLLVLALITVSSGIASCTQTSATSIPTPLPTLQPGSYERTLTIRDQTRSYLFHVPPGLDNLRPVPLVVGIHGYSWNATGFQYGSDFSQIADANAFLVVYPQGDGGDLPGAAAQAPGG